MSIYHYLKLDQLTIVALPSSKMPAKNKNGQKDIIKVECPADICWILISWVLSTTDRTANIIKNEIVTRKSQTFQNRSSM